MFESTTDECIEPGMGALKLQALSSTPKGHSIVTMLDCRCRELALLLYLTYPFAPSPVTQNLQADIAAREKSG